MKAFKLKKALKDSIWDETGEQSISFKRSKEGKVISFMVASEGTVKDILFKKIN